MLRNVSRLFTSILFSIFVLLFISTNNATAQTSFRFASIADGHVAVSKFTGTINQIKTLSPNIIIFNGDLENDGVVTSEMDPLINVLKNSGLFNNTFLVRGNHDDHLANSSTLWQNYFATANKTLPSDVTNYVGINSSSTYLTYSFDYGNSRFIGLDVPGDANLLTSTQLTFLDNRLTDAENIGLTHAFIYFHGPEYCVESTHCGCQTISGCAPPSSFISVINKHPIVSATFHGHEHILAWTHMSNNRVSSLTNQYEQFITSSSGNPYSFTPYPARMDYYNYSNSLTAFASIDVNGNSFTVNFYHTGNTTPLWSKTFTKASENTKVGDVNGDNVVNIIDIGIIVDYYNLEPSVKPKADINEDGYINILDIGLVVDNYNP